MPKNENLEFLNILFGPNDHQLLLAKSEDKRFKKYLNSIELSRFILFPLNVALVLVVGVLAAFALLLEIVARGISSIYGWGVDGTWISPSFFNISKEDYFNELEKLKTK